MKKSSVIQNINPYYKEDKYYCVVKDRISENIRMYFPKKEFMTVNISWAAKRLSKMIRCYKLMKERTIHLIDNMKVRPNNIQNSIKYITRVKYLETKRKPTVSTNVSINENLILKQSKRNSDNKIFKEKKGSIFSQIYSELETQSTIMDNFNKFDDSNSSNEDSYNHLKDVKDKSQIKIRKKIESVQEITPRFSKVNL